MSTLRRVERDVLRRRVGNKSLSRHYKKLKSLQKGIKPVAKAAPKQTRKKSVLERVKELIHR